MPVKCLRIRDDEWSSKMRYFTALCRGSRRELCNDGIVEQHLPDLSRTIPAETLFVSLMLPIARVSEGPSQMFPQTFLIWAVKMRNIWDCP